jgi:tRNA dimethylallyltransferase
MSERRPKAVAVVGPTSSGKTSLSIKLAKQFDGEVISADSRQVYRGLNLGTGKVTTEEMDGVPHHLLDIADAKDKYTAAEFELDASAAIMDIHSKNKLPIIAGGTFFYLDMLRGIRQSAPVPPNEEFRIDLMEYSTEDLYKKLECLDPSRAEAVDEKNRPRLVRALEIINTLGHVPKQTKTDSPYDWLVIGIDVPKLRLHENIHKRLQERFDAGMIEEVEKLHQQGLTYERMYELGLEYRFISMHLQHEMKLDELFERLETKHRQYAKRQMTWLKRDKEINWFKPEDLELISNTVGNFLQS